MAPGLPPAPPASPFPFSDGLLPTLLAVSLSAVNLLRPVYGPDGTTIVDFTLDYLNPAAQRMAGLPEQPGTTALARFPEMATTGVFDFYCRAYAAGTPHTFEVNYQADGLDNYFRLAAQRHQDQLVVSFTDTADQPRTAVELTLRAAQAAERAARADAEAQRNELRDFVEHAPVAVTVYRGPEHRVELANATALAIWGRSLPDVRDRPVFDVLPEAGTPEIRAIFERVFATGVPYMAHEQPTFIHRHGRQEVVYWNFVFQPEYQPDGRISGIRSVGTEVTEQVLARQQVQQLNQELEGRVQARTEQLRHHQRLLPQIMRQVPAAIATLSGPEHRYTFFNDAYQTLTGGRTRAELSVAEVLPEIVAQGFIGLLDQVYATGEPFIGTEMPAQLFDAATGRPEPHFVDFIYQPLTDEQGHPEGILAFIVDVTEKVRARQQLETLQQQGLAAAQRQAAERESLYQVFEHTPACIALLRGPEHRFEYVNRAYQDLFPGRELVGHALAEALPDAADQGFLALLDGVYRTGETFFGNELPLAIAQPDGRPPRQAYFTFTYQVYREHGQVVGISIFAFDVAEQVRARRAREAEQQQLHELFLQAPAPIVILDGPELVFQLINPAYQRIFPGRDLLNKPLLEALPELVGTPIPGLFQGVYQTGEPVTVQEMPLLMARHEGAAPEEIYWTFTYQARRDAHGAIDGVRVFAHDVTEQVLARQARAVEQRQLQEVFEQAPVAIFVVRGEEYVFEVINPGMGQIVGSPPDQVLGQRFFDLLPGLADQGYRDLLAQVWHSGQEYVAHEQEARLPYHRDGESGYYNFNYVPLRDAEGRTTGIMCVAVEVTAQVRARQQVQELNQTLQATNAELGNSNQQLVRTNVDLDNFIYTASHDLKAPISNIEGLLDTLRDELPPDAGGEVAYILELMQDSVNRFIRTIEHLTDVSRLQKEHNQLPEPVSLAGIIEDVRLDLAPLLLQTGGRLHVDVRAVPTVQFSVKNLRSVVYNLVSNALKYCHPDRAAHVQVRGREEGAYHVLEVRDNGLGLDLTREQGLFGMFRRYHTHVEGSGIGLYMVKRMVENTGGRIEVHSTVGEGSTFTVYFPRP